MNTKQPHMTTLRFALCGFDRTGRIHAENIAHHPNATLTCVHDARTDRPDDVWGDPTIDAVIICTPIHSYYPLIVAALEHGKHVMCEQPIAETVEHMNACYSLAESKKRVLLCALNRRFDPALAELRGQMDRGDVGTVHHVATTSRNCMCTGSDLVCECAVHDIDLVGWLLRDRPAFVYASGSVADNATIVVEFERGVHATVTCSRHGPNYDQRVAVHGTHGTLTSRPPCPSSASSSAIALDYFISCITRPDTAVTWVSREDCTCALLTAKACEESLHSGVRVAVPSAETYRDFRTADATQQAIRRTYIQARTRQSYAFVERMRRLHLTFDMHMTMDEVFERLSSFVDVSDPDTDLPNYYHGLQTAEAIRRDGHPEWMQLVGLIHDVGKILFLKGCDEDGTSVDEQWAIVGDTFVVGCALPDTLLYPEWNNRHPDFHHPVYSTECGVYAPHCGLSNVRCSWGHDEYLYQVLRHHRCTLPEEAHYIIRFHSLYAHHRDRSYNHLMDDHDHDMLRWLVLFNQYDLYTKRDELVDEAKVRPYYDALIRRYMGDGPIAF